VLYGFQRPSTANKFFFEIHQEGDDCENECDEDGGDEGKSEASDMEHIGRCHCNVEDNVDDRIHVMDKAIGN
jgi:hypothetical protein